MILVWFCFYIVIPIHICFIVDLQKIGMIFLASPYGGRISSCINPFAVLFDICCFFRFVLVLKHILLSRAIYGYHLIFVQTILKCGNNLKLKTTQWAPFWKTCFLCYRVPIIACLIFLLPWNAIKRQQQRKQSNCNVRFRMARKGICFFLSACLVPNQMHRALRSNLHTLVSLRANFQTLFPSFPKVELF